MSAAAVHPARHALHTPTAEHSAPLSGSGSQYTPRAAYPSSVSLPAGAPAGAPSPPAGAGCAYRPPAAEQRPAPGACTRTSGCTCADCSASSAGVGPREPAVSMARTQLLPPPDERDLHSYGEMGGPAERPTPGSGQSGGGFGRRRVKPSPVLVGRRRRRRTAKDGTPAEEDPWAPPPRQRDNRMSLLRGRRPRALQKTVSSETPAWLADSNGSAATDAQQSQEKPMWLQSAPAATSSAPARDGGTGGALTPQIQLVPCSHCARCFKPDRLARHEAACPKNPAKAKRQVYDSKARSLPAEAQQRKSAEDAKQRQGSAGEPKKKKKKSSWRQKSAEFQAMLRASGNIRASISGGTAGSGDLPEPPVVEPAHDDRVTCPHCNRKFNEDVAERHIPRCADVKARPRTLTKGGGLSASQVGAKATKRG